MDEVVKEALADPEMVEELAEDLADEISGMIVDDPRYTQKFIQVAKNGTGFKILVVKAISEELIDDLD
ncbi:hypothetical protein MYX64_08355 [Nitrospinae bacterium AH_259_B05_G02_I21]|nr:hypothetical protein [Nitrospinae bacterium AH_259_B05_G02_I21]MDA2931928.1 hypothetical protein [Nitrospinae bacterium AH-259-F20]